MLKVNCCRLIWLGGVNHVVFSTDSDYTACFCWHGFRRLHMRSYLPGKMRLNKEAYFAMQPIYYPGFTIGGGIGEFGGLISTIILLFFTPYLSAKFWLTLVALLGLIGMQAVYWLFTHSVNKFWLENEKLSSFSSGFGQTYATNGNILMSRARYSQS